MPNATWPGAPLAQILEAEDSSNSFPDGSVVRSSGGKYNGYPIARNVSYASSEPLSGYIICSIADKATMENLFANTLHNGAQPVDAVLDGTGVTKSYLFTEPPIFRPMGDNWRCSMSFEILP